jgi:hypothetical protein
VQRRFSGTEKHNLRVPTHPGAKDAALGSLWISKSDRWSFAVFCCSGRKFTAGEASYVAEILARRATCYRKNSKTPAVPPLFSLFSAKGTAAIM